MYVATPSLFKFILISAQKIVFIFTINMNMDLRDELGFNAIHILFKFLITLSCNSSAKVWRSRKIYVKCTCCYHQIKNQSTYDQILLVWVQERPLMWCVCFRTILSHVYIIMSVVLNKYIQCALSNEKSIIKIIMMLQIIHGFVRRSSIVHNMQQNAASALAYYAGVFWGCIFRAVNFGVLQQIVIDCGVIKP